jgi:dTDP-4-dehydrorhamnose 3,5-epimerase
MLHAIPSVPTLPPGARLIDLTPHADVRGDFTELFRESWDAGQRPVQWNMVRSRANVLRGIHVHPDHEDYLVVLSGRMQLWLHDVRPASPACGKTIEIALDGTQPRAVVVPTGVAHGFYFPVESIHAYALSTYWDVRQDIGCHWTVPEIGMQAPANALLSERDAQAAGYDEMVDAYLAFSA